MKLNHDNDRRLYHLFEEKLVEISQRVGYGGEETDSDAYRVFEEAWVIYLKGIGVERVPPFVPDPNGWSPTEDILYFDNEQMCDEGVAFISDPLYATGDYLKMQDEIALRILALGALPESPAPTVGP